MPPTGHRATTSTRRWSAGAAPDVRPSTAVSSRGGDASIDRFLLGGRRLTLDEAVDGFHGSVRREPGGPPVGPLAHLSGGQGEFQDPAEGSPKSRGVSVIDDQSVLAVGDE